MHQITSNQYSFFYEDGFVEYSGAAVRVDRYPPFIHPTPLSQSAVHHIELLTPAVDHIRSTEVDALIRTAKGIGTVTVFN